MGPRVPRTFKLESRVFILYSLTLSLLIEFTHVVTRVSRGNPFSSTPSRIARYNGTASCRADDNCCIVTDHATRSAAHSCALKNIVVPGMCLRICVYTVMLCCGRKLHWQDQYIMCHREFREQRSFIKTRLNTHGKTRFPVDRYG